MEFDIQKYLTIISESKPDSQSDLQNELDIKITEQIQKVLLDSTGMSDVDDYQYVENDHSIKNYDTSYIADPTFDAIGIAFKGLTEEQIKEISKDVWKQYQYKNTATNSSSTSDSSYMIGSNKSDTTNSYSRWIFSSDYNAYENLDALGFTNTVGTVLGKTGDILVKGLESDVLDAVMESIKNVISTGVAGANIISDDLLNLFDKLGSADSLLVDVMSTILGMSQSRYQDGVTETSFGNKQEQSWYGSSNAFLNYYQQQNKLNRQNSYKINFIDSPLNSGGTREALYGTFMLGAPFLFNESSDPTNRSLINTFIKDGKFLSLTPGLPKFNGTYYRQTMQTSGDTIFSQTSTPQQMLEYLQRNGLDSDFSSKDKRYYTFKTDYEDYFAYLETMLNTVWIKMGLSENNKTFNLFSFFNMQGSSDDIFNAENYKSLKSQYNSSIGFFTNPSGAVVESIDSSQTSFGIDSKANSMSEEYQRMNYLTGMGTGTSSESVLRMSGIAVNSVSSVISEISSNVNTFKSLIGNSKISTLTKVIGAIPALTADFANYKLNNDLGAVMQSLSTTNGMKVRFPELWNDSQYSRSASFNFQFISPYGDPLSVFKYVYVPFFALLCFAMPRQAAENGLVSPFFVRASIPGMYNADLAIISSISWTKGGSANLWTKDGLPRAIDVTIQIQDLYSFMAMSKRLSFLSANPSYAIFLDQFSGLFSLNDTSNDDALNEYFKNMIDYANGTKNKNMWNKLNSRKTLLAKNMMKQNRQSISALIDSSAIPWLHNSSL